MSANCKPPIISSKPPVITSRGELESIHLKEISGVEGLTVQDLQDFVERGGRFVVFQYCFSVLILTFRRSSPVVFLRPGANAIQAGLSFTAISLFFGWWGIPWGPIWTLTSIATNLSGGRDVTRQVMTAMGVPPPQSRAITMRSPDPAHESHKTFILRAAWTVVALMMLAVASFGFWIVHNILREANKPAYTSVNGFQDIDEQLVVNRSVGAGNTQQTADFARVVAEELTEYRSIKFSMTAQSSTVDEYDGIRAYCSLHSERCVVLIYVPRLQQFDSKVRSTLEEVAWTSVQSHLIEEGLNSPGIVLVVGIRGDDGYDCVLTGSGMINVRGAVNRSPSRTEGVGCERELQSWFAGTSLSNNAYLELPASPEQVH